MTDNCCVFILSHGRSDRVYTWDTLRRQGYTGPIYVVVDDEDKQLDEYKRRFGDHVLVFNKAEVAKTFDEGDNFQDRRTAIYARNVCHDLARSLEYRYFWEFDDDYKRFEFRYEQDGFLRGHLIEDLDHLFELFLDFFRSVPAHTIAMAQGGDYIGGLGGSFGNRILLRRKAMNTFLCDVERPFKFVGCVNDDVNTYTSLGRRGFLLFTVGGVMVHQLPTQSNAGGMTDTYLDSGTYVKSFYTVMYSPSSARMTEMTTAHRRIHHEISWSKTVPEIVREDVTV